MPTQHAFACPMVAVSAVLLLTLATGCSKSGDHGGTGTAPATSVQAVASASQTKGTSRLGDLC
jgi:hypothetical protein